MVEDAGAIPTTPPRRCSSALSHSIVTHLYHVASKIKFKACTDTKTYRRTICSLSEPNNPLMLTMTMQVSHKVDLFMVNKNIS